MFPTAVVEAARAAKNIPADWLYAPCENGCGQLVFYPPVEQRPSRAREDTPVIIVCSTTCAVEVAYGERFKT